LRFTATDVYDFYKPTECARRVALRARDEPEPETATAFDKLLQTLGRRHEAAHLATLRNLCRDGDLLDLSTLKDNPLERERLTLEAIRSATPAAVIYQLRFRLTLPIAGTPVELVGEPDFLIHDPAAGGYRIRDSKLARNVLASRHCGIPLQLQIYGLLFERLTGQRPVGIEVHAGTDALVPIPYLGDAAVLEELARHLRMRTADPAEYEPVGWTKCGGCPFHDRCWAEAETANDVALLTAVGQERARALRARGITTIRQLPAAIDDPAHRDYFWEGKKKPHPRSFVAGLRRGAEAFLSGKPILIAAPDLPPADDCVTLDLEGLPPYLDELEKIYLWGIKDHRGNPGRFLPALAGFGPEGDRDGWEAFLSTAAALLDERPNLRFVHWGSYERTGIERYVERYGDADGTAARVLDRLVDLLTVVRNSVALPLPSYGLKVVEKIVGFERRLTEYQGSVAMARYVEATETPDPAAREAIIGEILAYNEEDLDATWKVLEWRRNMQSS
jgi:predicted RecB family nuclease